jgi:hypothetical protein
VQRALLLEGADILAQRTVATVELPAAAVVFVVSGSDDAANTVSALEQCAQLLAPCTPQGLQSLRAADAAAAAMELGSDKAGQPRLDSRDTRSCPDCRSTNAGSLRPAQHEHGASDAAYAMLDTAPLPWPSLLHAPGIAPVPVVLQAVTPAMLEDVSPCSARSTASACHTKLVCTSTTREAGATGATGAAVDEPGARALQQTAAVMAEPSEQQHLNSKVPGGEGAAGSTVRMCQPTFKLARSAVDALTAACVEWQQSSVAAARVRECAEHPRGIASVAPTAGVAPVASAGDGRPEANAAARRRRRSEEGREQQAGAGSSREAKRRRQQQGQLAGGERPRSPLFQQSLSREDLSREEGETVSYEDPAAAGDWPTWGAGVAGCGAWGGPEDAGDWAEDWQSAFEQQAGMPPWEYFQQWAASGGGEHIRAGSTPGYPGSRPARSAYQSWAEQQAAHYRQASNWQSLALPESAAGYECIFDVLVAFSCMRLV